MRRLAQGITGALAVALMVLRQPWDLRDCPGGACHYYSDETLLWVIFGMAVYVGFIAVIMTVVLVGVLGIRDSGRAADSAVLAALGQSRRSAVREAALRGLKDGALVTGAAFVTAAALNVWIVLSTGYGLDALDPLDFVGRLVVAIGFTGMLVLAHVIDAMRPRRTPVERLYEDAAPPRPRRVPLALRFAVLGGVAAACIGVLAGTAVAHDNANGDAGTIPSLLAQWALIIFGFAGVALFFTVGVPLIGNAIPALLRGGARLANAARATRASAILSARATTASGASVRTVLAIAGLALLAGVGCGANPDPALSPSYVGTVTLQPADIADEIAAEYATIDGVGTIIIGMQYGEQPAATGVNIDEVAAVDHGLADLMRSHPGAVIMEPRMYDATLDSFAAQGIPISGIVPISTCCSGFVDQGIPTGPATYASLTIYAAPGADPAAVASRVDSFSPASTHILGWGTSLAYYGNGGSQIWSALIVWALVLAVCLAPAIALAVGVVSRRRRDDATLAALGASRRTLTGVAVVETTAISVAAVAGGLIGGALLQASLSTASRARDSLDGLITDSYAHVFVGSVAWDTLAWIFAGTVAGFAVVAWIVTRLGARRLPVEQLRIAEMGRVA